MLAESIVEGLDPSSGPPWRRPKGPLLVIAGAGSGKTRVLTYRIAYLIGVWASPREHPRLHLHQQGGGRDARAGSQASGSRGRGRLASTFHSACVRILRRDIGHLGRSRGFVIYDDSDSLGVVKEALRRQGLENGSPKRAA